MALKERIEQVAQRLRGREDSQPPQYLLKFCELTDPDEARKSKLKLGYYFVVENVGLREGLDKGFVGRLSSSLSDLVHDFGPEQEEGTRLYVDNHGSYVDLGRVWKFARVSYFPFQKRLLISAEMVDPDTASSVIKGVFSKKG